MRSRIIRHVRPYYARGLCEKIFQTPAPAQPIEKGRPWPPLQANIAVSKFADGLPLYRQVGILAREGIEIGLPLQFACKAGTFWIWSQAASTSWSG